MDCNLAAEQSDLRGLQTVIQYFLVPFCLAGFIQREERSGNRHTDLVHPSLCPVHADLDILIELIDQRFVAKRIANQPLIADAFHVMQRNAFAEHDDLGRVFAVGYDVSLLPHGKSLRVGNVGSA